MAETLGPTFGAMLIGFGLDSVFFGTSLILTAHYFRNFRKDPWQTRLVVGGCIVLSVLQWATLLVWLYWSLIASSGDAAQMAVMPPAAFIQLFSIYSIAFISQCFFAWRIWRLTNGSIVLTGIVLILAFLQIGGGIAETTMGALLRNLTALDKTKTITTIQSSAAAACDVCITVILSYVLHGRRTGIESTDKLLDKLILFAISRGALTAFAAFLNMLLFLLKPTTLLNVIPLFPSGNLYIISVVTSLTFRVSVCENCNRKDNLVMPMSSVPQSEGQIQFQSPRRTGVHVTTSKVTWIPGEPIVTSDEPDWQKESERDDW